MTWQPLELDGPVGPFPVGAHPAGDPDRRLVVVRTPDGRVHATDRACPHLGHPLTMGSLEGETIECGHHVYRYSLADGVCVHPGGPLAGRLTLHEVRVADEGLEVRLAADPA